MPNEEGTVLTLEMMVAAFLVFQQPVAVSAVWEEFSLGDLINMPFDFYGWIVAGESPPSTPPPGKWPTPIAERRIIFRQGLDDEKDLSPGRRLRAFSQMIGSSFAGKAGDIYRLGEGGQGTALLYTEPLTYAEALADCEAKPAYREMFANLPLRIGQGPMRYSADPNYAPHTRDPELPVALHDLASEILEDVREACFALDDPDLYYPGVDEGIDPVPEDHVALVIWALQRELNRELRNPSSSAYGTGVLPAVPLKELPWRIQRALAERRRLRFKQYGIGHEQWEAGSWSLWDVPLDPEFVPRRNLRKAGLL